jgi:hypothetical protein
MSRSTTSIATSFESGRAGGVRPRSSRLTTLGAVAMIAFGCSSGPTRPSSIESSSASLQPSGTAGGAPTPARFTGRGTPGVVFVTSQHLYYDTFVVKDPLPMEGPFQLLTNGQTEFGPGQPGYVGGRWWEDSNGNGVQDSSDHFFLCPLLPPGRPTP